MKQNTDSNDLAIIMRQLPMKFRLNSCMIYTCVKSKIRCENVVNIVIYKNFNRQPKYCEIQHISPIRVLYNEKYRTNCIV